MVGEPSRVGVVLLNLQVGLVVKQPVQDVGRIKVPNVDELWKGEYWSETCV